MKKNNIELKNAFKIGFVCVFTYLACYYLRNVLGVFTPQMLETGLFEEKADFFESIFAIRPVLREKKL